MNESGSTVAAVREILVDTLGIPERAASLDASTSLLGGIPELDSLGILEIVSAVEQKFDIEIDDEDFTDSAFETVGSLAELIDQKRTS